jgi:hypothetical protein
MRGEPLNVHSAVEGFVRFPWNRGQLAMSIRSLKNEFHQEELELDARGEADPL